ATTLAASAARGTFYDAHGGALLAFGDPGDALRRSSEPTPTRETPIRSFRRSAGSGSTRRENLDGTPRGHDVPRPEQSAELPQRLLLGDAVMVLKGEISLAHDEVGRESLASRPGCRLSPSCEQVNRCRRTLAAALGVAPSSAVEALRRSVQGS
ncbi:MAG: hypothetical protein ACREQY_05120, partial [Candidatus Binatia bacterium]